MLPVHFGAASDSGAVRDTNEDCALAAGGIAAVADGMGGHAAGDVASQLAVTRLRHLALDESALTPDLVLGAIAAANQDILDAAADPTRAGMGTTLSGVGAVQVGGVDHWMVFNVGDSRVYRLSGQKFTQVTVDHSVVQELIEAGALSREEAKVDSRRNVVTRSLGTDPPPQADVWVFPPTDGERFLVCSDGLTLEIDDDEIANVLRTESDAQRAADALVAAAVSAGGHDNVTAVVVDLALDAHGAGVEIDTAPRQKPPLQGEEA